MEAEFQAMDEEDRLEDERRAEKRKLLGKPDSCKSLRIINDNYQLLRGSYDYWVYNGSLILEVISLDGLTLTLRDDWNKETISGLGLDNPSYSLTQLSRGGREYFISINDGEKRYRSIPISDIVSVEERGDLVTGTKITGAKQVGRKTEIISQVEIKDDRYGVIVVNSREWGVYEISFKYPAFNALKTTVECAKKEM